jgi:hypothetical protein
MSFRQDPKTEQVVIHCHVCSEPILHAEDGKVEWNSDGPFTFVHYECSDPDVFQPEFYEFWTPLERWVESLTLTYPLNHDFEPEPKGEKE